MQYVKNVLLGSSACLLASSGIFAADDAFAPVAVKADAFSGIHVGAMVSGQFGKAFLGGEKKESKGKDSSFDVLGGAYLGYERALGPVTVGGRVSALYNFYTSRDEAKATEAKKESKKSEKVVSGKKASNAVFEDRKKKLSDNAKAFLGDLKDDDTSSFPDIKEYFSYDKGDPKDSLNTARIGITRKMTGFDNARKAVAAGFSAGQPLDVALNNNVVIPANAAAIPAEILNHAEALKGDSVAFKKAFNSSQVSTALQTVKGAIPGGALNAIIEAQLAAVLLPIKPLLVDATVCTNLAQSTPVIDSLLLMANRPPARAAAAYDIGEARAALAVALNVPAAATADEFFNGLKAKIETQAKNGDLVITPTFTDTTRFVKEDVRAVYEALCQGLQNRYSKALDNVASLISTGINGRIKDQELQKMVKDEFFAALKAYPIEEKDLTGLEIFTALQTAFAQAKTALGKKLVAALDDKAAAALEEEIKKLDALTVDGSAPAEDKKDEEEKADAKEEKSSDKAHALYEYNYIVDAEVRLGYVMRNIRPYVAVGGSMAGVTRKKEGVEDESRTVWGFKGGAGVGMTFMKNMVAEVGYTYHRHFSSGTKDETKHKGYGKKWDLSRHGVVLSLGVRI